ncbi:hypothetical protein EV210_114127 [Anaerospora hongkongensis]|uniref:Uncharacterized protein n=1 Tax=Anaerospora hongkongensis TaxID=244830 RepID=A0A4R1PW65_9FIRM|nr:hypothetical protein EV210_114127 [Anaerospora hongkongensis]
MDNRLFFIGGCSAQWQKDGYHSMSGCPLLAALRYAAFSSSAPNRPPLALRVVACREAIRAGHGMQTGALLITRTRTAGYVGWPRTLRGASAGHSSRTGRNTIDRPSRASCRPPGTENKAANRYAGPPGTTRLAGWQASRSCPAVAAPVPPRGHEKHVSTLRPPFPPSPPSLVIGAAIQAVGRN